MTMSRRLVFVVFICLSATTASAQSGDSPPAISAGAAAGVALPFHGDFDFIPWAWEADLRIRLSRRVLVEAVMGDWRHTERLVFTGLPSIARLEQTSERVQRSWQVNALSTRRIGRVWIVGGGGVGLVQHRRSTFTIAEGCAAGVACGEHESVFSNASAAVQGVGGMEVGATGPVALSATARLVVPLRDPAGMDLRFTAGIRLRLGRSD